MPSSPPSCPVLVSTLRRFVRLAAVFVLIPGRAVAFWPAAAAASFRIGPAHASPLRSPLIRSPYAQQQPPSQHDRRAHQHPLAVRGLQQNATTNQNNDDDDDDDDECLSLIGDIIRSGAQGKDWAGLDVSISQNGQFMALGARLYKGAAGKNTGLVQVYENVNSHWTQRGTNIEGENAFDVLSANALSNDGTILAVGADGNDENGKFSGHVRVFQFNVAMGDWQQLGDTLGGLATGDRFGGSVALSDDGTILAVGAKGGGPNNKGQVRFFSWNGSSWVNRGNAINGENNGGQLGSSIALAEHGSIFAVGVQENGGKGGNRRNVQVFEFGNDGGWNHMGQVLDGGNAGDNGFGWSIVSLSSDGRTLAMGVLYADASGLFNSGQVRVYRFNENNQLWAQQGSSLTVDSVNDEFGHSVSLSGDGLTVAVGAPESLDGKGFLRLFHWDGGQWQPFGNDLVGATAGDELGTAVALAADGSTLVVGGSAYVTDRPGVAMVVQLNPSCQLSRPSSQGTMDNSTPQVSVDNSTDLPMGVLFGVIVGFLALIAACVAVWAIRRYRKWRQQEDFNHDNNTAELDESVFSSCASLHL